MVKFVKTNNNKFGVVVDEDDCGSWVKLRNTEGLVCLKSSQYVVVGRSGVNESSNMQLELVKALKNAMLMAENQRNILNKQHESALKKQKEARRELEDAEQQYKNANQQLTTATQLSNTAVQIYVGNNGMNNFKHKSQLEYLAAKENENMAAEAMAAFDTKYNIYANKAAAAAELAAAAEKNLESVEQNLDSATAQLSIPERIVRFFFNGGKKSRRR